MEKEIGRAVAWWAENLCTSSIEGKHGLKLEAIPDNKIIIFKDSLRELLEYRFKEVEWNLRRPLIGSLSRMITTKPEPDYLLRYATYLAMIDRPDIRFPKATMGINPKDVWVIKQSDKKKISI